ncbi:g8003 [Coccomyxa elongata]
MGCSLHSNVQRPVFATRCLTRVSRSRQTSSIVRCDASRRGVLKDQLLSALVGSAALAAVALTRCTPLAWAELETVPPATVSSLARALPKQQVDKGRIWLICILGAAGLFGGTVLLENNEKFFPAISKANKAMAQARKQQEARAKLQEAIDVGGDAEERLEDAVLAGISEARQRVLSEPSSAPQESSSSKNGGDDTKEQHAPDLQQSVQDSESRSNGNKEEVSDDHGMVNSKRELVDSRNQSKA